MKHSATFTRPLVRALTLGCLFGALAVLSGCPGERSADVEEAIAPRGVRAEFPTPGDSVVDQVEVMSPDEAMQEAIQEIDESNVLEALEALEKEIGSDE
jgi:hypothetical protein